MAAFKTRSRLKVTPPSGRIPKGITGEQDKARTKLVDGKSNHVLVEVKKLAFE